MTRRISVYLPVVPFAAIALYSYLSLVLFDFGRAVPFDFFDETSKSDALVGATLFLLSAVFLSVGIKLSGVMSLGNVNSLSSGPVFRNLIYFWVMLSIFNYNLSDLIYRDVYVVEARLEVLSKLGQILLPVVSFQLGKFRTTGDKFFFLIYFLLLFSLNTRSLSLLVGFVLILNFHRFRACGRLFLFALLLFSSALPVFLRSAANQGLVGNFVSLFELSPIWLFDAAVFAVNYVLSYPVSLLLKIYNFGESVEKIFLASITPLPSSFLPDPLVFNLAKFNEFAPFSAIGVLFYKLNIFSLAFWFLYGLLYGIWLRLLPTGILRFLFAASIFLAVTLSTVYGLRNVFVFSIVVFFTFPFMSLIRDLLIRNFGRARRKVD